MHPVSDWVHIKGLLSSSVHLASCPSGKLLQYLVFYTYYDHNNKYDGDFDILPPHGSGQAFAGFLECERLGKNKNLNILLLSLDLF